MPKFAHLPLILKPDGNGKLSKRDGDRLGFPVFPLEWKDPTTSEVSSGYREKGYFPEAFVNMMVFLGWNPGTSQELFSLEELTQAFSLDRVGKSGAKFDPDKTKWFNQQYLRAKSNEELGQLLGNLVEGEFDSSFLAAVAGMMKERASFPVELSSGTYFFTAPEVYDEKTQRKKWKEETPDRMRALAKVFESVEPFYASNIENAFKQFLIDEELGMGAVLPNFRLLLTGQGMGPSMFQIAELLGKEETLKRMSSGILKLA